MYYFAKIILSWLIQSSLFLFFWPVAIEVGFQKQAPSITEGSDVIAVIERQLINNQAPFEVTVHFKRYTGPLNPDEGALGPRDDGMY